MKVSGIFIYPIKSCQGIALTETEVLPQGFAWDREFMLVDQLGNFLTISPTGNDSGQNSG